MVFAFWQVEKNRIGAVAARELVFLYAQATTSHTSRMVMNGHEITPCFPEELPPLHHQIHVHDQLPLGDQSLPHHKESDPQEIP